MNNKNTNYNKSRQNTRSNDRFDNDDDSNRVNDDVDTKSYSNNNSTQTTYQNKTQNKRKNTRNSNNKERAYNTNNTNRHPPGTSPISLGTKDSKQPIKFQTEPNTRSTFSEYAIPNTSSVNIEESDFTVNHSSPEGINGYFYIGNDPFRKISKMCHERLDESKNHDLLSFKIDINPDALFIYFIFSLVVQLFNQLSITNNETFLSSFRQLTHFTVPIPEFIGVLSTFFGTINSQEGIYKMIGIETILLNQMLHGYILTTGDKLKINHLIARESTHKKSLTYNINIGYLFKVSNMWEALVYLSKAYILLENNDEFPLTKIKFGKCYLPFDILHEDVDDLVSKLHISTLSSISKEKIKYLLLIRKVKKDKDKDQGLILFEELLPYSDNLFLHLNIQIIDCNTRTLLQLYLSDLLTFHNRYHSVISTSFKFAPVSTCMSGNLGQIVTYENTNMTKVEYKLSRTDLALGYMLGVNSEFIHCPEYTVISNLNRDKWLKKQIFNSTLPLLK